MRARWLGWAGVELEAEGAAIVIDPLADPSATWRPLGPRAADAELPEIVAPAARGTAVAGLVTHLHRDHADAGALHQALAPGAPVLGPPAGGGDGLENAALAQAAAELAAAGLQPEAVEAWTTREAGPFRATAVPAVDGSGDPQVSWVVEAGGHRVLHLGDTMFHGYWWRIARRLGPFDVVFAPVNGAVLNLPHRQPASTLAAAMDPEQAAVAAHALGARAAVPIHYGGFTLDPVYRPVGDALRRFERAAADRDVAVRALAVGATLELAAEGAAA